ncbi:MAG: HRDC domain-containing protein, partial [Methanoregula sp.]
MPLQGIFPDKSLREMAMKRPCNREHFATISGAGVQPGGIWAGLSRRDPEGERGLAGI